MTGSLRGGTAGVWLHGTKVGIFQKVGTVAQFSFLQSYLGDPDRATMSYHVGPDPADEFRRPMKFPVWFENLLPEGKLEQLVRRQVGGITATNFDLLVALGRDLPGAVEVLPEENDSPFLGIGQNSPARAATEYDDRDDGLVHFSLAGVGLKFSGVDVGDHFVSGAIAGGQPRILKLPDSSYPNLPRNEYLIMDLAAACGIEVPDRRLVSKEQVGDGLQRFFLGEDLGYSIARFDRGSRDDSEKIHIEDFLQLRWKEPREKYQGKQESLFNIVRNLCGADDYEEAVRRFVFNTLVDNTDAHWKNWSVCYPNKISPRLSPAYDLVCTGVYNNRDLGFQGNIVTEMALPFNGRKRAEQVRRKDVEVIGRLLKEPDFVNLIFDTASQMREVIAEFEVEGAFEEQVMRHICSTTLPLLSG